MKKRFEIKCLFVLLFGVVVAAQVRLEPDPTPSNFPNNSILSPKEKPFSIDLLNEKFIKPLEIREKDNDIDFLGKKKYKSNKELFDYSKLESNPNISLDAFRRNQYLGDATTDKDYVQVVCRDYSYVDGDIINVYINGKQIATSIVLQGEYHTLKVKLEPGFNKIEFEAKNMGSSPPNTAELVILDEDGLLISNHQWALATGFKASFIVAKN